MQASPGVGKSMGTRKVLGNGDIRHVRMDTERAASAHADKLGLIPYAE